MRSRGLTRIELWAAAVLALATAPGAAATQDGLPAERSAEDAGPAVLSVSDPARVREAIKEYIGDTLEEEGAFFIDDERTGHVRELQLLEISTTVGERDGYAWGRARMRDVDSGETVELEFDVEPFEDDLEVSDVRVLSVVPPPSGDA